MNKSDYLKNRFPFYIGSGVVLGLALSALIVLHSYNEHLWQVLNDMHKVSINTYRMKKQIRELDAASEHFRSRYRVDFPGTAPGTVLLRALDSFRADMPEASIAVKEIKKTAEGSKLPVELEAPMKNYAMVLDYVNCVEEFRIPDFRISHMRVFHDPAAGIILRLSGYFLMPSLGGEA